MNAVVHNHYTLRRQQLMPEQIIARGNAVASHASRFTKAPQNASCHRLERGSATITLRLKQAPECIKS